ncbi:MULTISPECIES: XkdF-like putative serine protease domain-containing protein [unclassified Bradyrhizobium]|uniref:XkdF-like putative serine protease domain-containing protein n=1 Tax=unclassified Bradyrhizobium TaxID=2631580 RepID=UPI003391158B
MTPDELIATASDQSSFQVALKKVDAKKHIATGIVYVPNVLDTHDEMMLAADVELMAHRFMLGLKNNQIDLMHGNRVVQATAVESFIARAGDPDYPEGAWVMSIKVDDAKLWGDIESGKYNGYSVETYITKVDADVELTFYPHVFGHTEKTDGHDHVFFIQIDADGKINGGETSAGEDGHVHKITFGTATDMAEKHAHRYRLP